MPKYKITDELGNKFEVIEETEEVKDEEVIEPAVEEVKDDESSTGLSTEEIAALKKLAAVADKLVSLLDIEEAEHEAVEDEEPIEEKEDELSMTEEVIDTKSRDSKSSYGSTETTKKKIDDSIDEEQEIANAWTKRFANMKGE